VAEDGRRALARAFAAPELAVEPTLEPAAALDAHARPALARLSERFGPEWQVAWDRRSGRPHLAQGSGIAILPGRGNDLRPEDVGLAAGGAPTLELLEGRLRALLESFPELLDLRGLDLRLDRSRSVAYGAGDSHWFVELAQFADGVPVAGAHVFFRLSHGNLVQLGADRVAPVGIDTRPGVDRESAWTAMLAELEIAGSAQVREVLDAGTLRLYPAALDGEAPGERFSGSPGSGYTHRLAWRFSFRLAGEATTYQVLFDAHLGRVLEVRDLDVYADASVTGGIYPTTNSEAETVVPFPFVNVSSSGTQTTDAAGVYDYAGGTATSTLDGRYFQIDDDCGGVSLSDSTDGNLEFGAGGGTDCATPGSGGNGNTHAARNAFYHLTRINRSADAYLPANAWIDSKVVALTNVDEFCNARWDGSAVNFYVSDPACANSGEIASIVFHEWGHGLDQNTGGAATELGSGEALGDTFAFLQTRDGCIGPNFRLGSNCPNCSACDGVRDVSDFDLSGPATIATPANVASDSGTNCDRFACPYSAGFFPYQGPMGYEGHCESYIASAANWDLAQMLVAEHGTEPGWAAMAALWYGSLTPSKSAYRLASGGKCNPAASVDGCAATNWYTVYLAVDDDDGNLANGTPNGCRIWDAFSAHGIACGSRPACFGLEIFADGFESQGTDSWDAKSPE
jgi:hypothetical protein